MGDGATTIVPIVGFFLLGVLLRRAAIARSEDGQFLLRLLFYVALPALIVVTLAEASLPIDKALLPLSCIAVSAVGLAAAMTLGRRRGLPPARLGPLVLGSMILNNAFLIPFVLAGYGTDGFADLVLFDLGNSLMVSLVAFPLAFRFGGHDADLRSAIRRTLSAPLTWSIATGLLLGVTDTEIPDVLDRFLSPLGATVGPLILVALGILFRPSTDDLDQVVATVALRMGLGTIVGLAIAAVIGLDGDTRTVVVLAAASPIGFTALTFSSLAGLDAAVAARAVSASLLVGMIATPIVVLLTS